MTAVSLAVIMAIRSMGKTMEPLIISFAAVLINIILNYILINGKLGFPIMGVRGSALATTIARIIEVSLYIWLIWKNGYYLNARKEINLSKWVLKRKKINFNNKRKKQVFKRIESHSFGDKIKNIIDKKPQ